jgi:hypothetical protein
LTISNFKFWDGTTSASGTPNVALTFTDVPAVDEKETITNIPAGTRWHETDTKKIFRREVGALDNTTGLRFHYKFDEASGDVKNYGSVASADLTVSGLTRDVSTPSGLGNGMSTPSQSSGDYAQNTSRVNDYKFMHDGSKWSVTFWAYLTDVPDSGGPTETGCIGNIWTDDNGIGWTVRWAKDGSASTTSCRIQSLIADGSSGMPLNDQTADSMMPELPSAISDCILHDVVEAEPSLAHLTVQPIPLSSVQILPIQPVSVGPPESGTSVRYAQNVTDHLLPSCINL